MTDLAVQSSVPASFIDEWERQPGETAKAFTAFTIFRDMGDDRGVHAVRDQAGGAYSHTSLVKWAKNHRWIERALAYDRMIDRRRQKAHIDEVEAMARRQVHIGQTLQQRGLEYVKEQLDTPEQRASNLNANGALRFIDRGVDLEREGLGMNEKDSGVDVNVQVNVLDAGTKVSVFDKINEMANNAQRVEAMMRERSGIIPAEPEDVIDAELVEGDEE